MRAFATLALTTTTLAIDPTIIAANVRDELLAADIDNIAAKVVHRIRAAQVRAEQSTQTVNGCVVVNGVFNANDPNCKDCTYSSGSLNCNSKSSVCFAKDSSTACLLEHPLAECKQVLMADLVPGDLVLGREGATSVVAVQHKAIDTIAPMLTFHTADGAVSMTPDHGIFVDGRLVAAAEVKVGSVLSTGAVERIVKSKGAIINPVTSSGTIIADGVLAASNPMWIASLTADMPLVRAIVNAALYAAGDVDNVAAGCGRVLAKLAAALAAAAVVHKARKTSA